MKDKNIHKPTYDDIVSMITDALNKVGGDPRLKEISSLEDFDDETRKMLEPFYQSTDITVKRFASILNSIYTHATNTFVLTYGMAVDLVTNDPNHKLKSFDGVAYNKMLTQFAVQGGFLTVLKEPVKSKKEVERKAGLYELTNENLLYPLVLRVGKTNLQARRHALIEWHEKNNTPTQKDSPPKDKEKEQLLNDFRRKINERET